MSATKRGSGKVRWDRWKVRRGMPWATAGALGVTALLTYSSFPLYWCWVAFWSALAVLFYAWDKWQATRDKRRIPEKTLHVLALLGGWPGAWIARETLRHKTQKKDFGWVLILSGVLHLGILYSLIRG